MKIKVDLLYIFFLVINIDNIEMIIECTFYGKKV